MKRLIVHLLLLFFFFSQHIQSQCFEIESILVDACGPQEGLSEMFRFRVGPNPLNTATLNVNWPNNAWQGLIQNAFTASQTAAFNSQISNAGGCAQLIEPIGGVLPANSTVILVTSFNVNTVQNPFGAISEDIYILYQNNPTNGTGHFANFGVGIRTLSMTIGGCFDTVSYDRSLLVNQAGLPGPGDGATVLFEPDGTATYVNFGCFAPVPPFLVDIVDNAFNVCAGSTLQLSATAVGQQSLLWSAPEGVFSDTTLLNPTFTIPGEASGTLVLTLTATDACGNTVTDTVPINLTPATVPDFPTELTFCSSATAPSLETTSPNGISGTWSPGVIDMTSSGTYLFTPNPNQCAAEVTLTVNIVSEIVPNFATSLTLCSSETTPSLDTTSPNGITGTWSPGVIDMTTSGTYVFTPNPNQCATSVSLTVTIQNEVVPNFATTLTLCSSDTAPSLETTSPNGITGTWSPGVIDMTTSGTYVFTPNPNQCTTSVSLTVTIQNEVVPNFATSLTLCSSDTAPSLETTSPNGITGNWSPGVIDMTASGTYVFTPNPNQCASTVSLTVTIQNEVVPNFATSLTLCSSDTAPSLETTSPNDITGTWSPGVIDMTTSGTYVFTPNPNQCATSVSLTITIQNEVVPNFATSLTLCSNETAPSLEATSPNGISGTWSPSMIDMTNSGTYVFTPIPNQCAAEVSLTVTIVSEIVPNFATSLTLCSSDTAPSLDTTSPNGISGSWTPNAIDMTTGGTYVFTPNPNQCATSVSLTITIQNEVVPNFATSLTLCSSDTAPSLEATSPNGISGTWSPGAIDMTASGTYVFTPNPNQCAAEVTLTVTIESEVVPNFATTLTLCSSDTAPALNTTSPNGISGTWSPNAIDMTTDGTYVFTPNPNQCATTTTLEVTIESITGTISGDTTLCEGDTTTWTVSLTGGVWSSEDPSIVTVDANGNLVAVTPGTTTIRYVVSGSCDLELSQNVTVFGVPTPNFSDVFICVDPLTGLALAPVLLESGLNAAQYSFVWSLNGDIVGTDATLLVSEPGIYSLTTTHTQTGCTGTVTVSVLPSSAAIATLSIAFDFQRNQTITVSVTGGSGDYVYQLNNGPLQSSPVFSPVPQGENTVIVRDLNGCDDVVLTIYSFNYPPFFTPNNDNYNDTWDIEGLDNQLNARLFIYDRYGKLLKQLKPSVGEGWDGTYLGAPLPSTDYWFSLFYTDRDGVEREFKAHFSLKR